MAKGFFLTKKDMQLCTNKTAKMKEAKKAVHVEGTTIKLSGYFWTGISNDLNRQIKNLEEAGEKEIEVYIKSWGGNAYEGPECVNIIRDARKRGLIFSGRGGAYIASTAAFLAQEFEKFTLSSNSLYMIHKPSTYIEGNEDTIESDLKSLKILTRNYEKQSAKKSNLSIEQIKGETDKGDYWMDADEALKNGFANAIDGEEEITEGEITAMKEAGFNKFANRLKGHNKFAYNIKTDEMETKKLNNLLEIPTGSKTSDIEARIANLKNSASKVQDLEAQLETFREKEKTAKTAKIKEVLAQAVRDKKIKADERTQARWKKTLENDFENGEIMLNEINQVEKLSSKLSQEESDSKRADWTFKDYQEKDVKALGKMKKEEPQKFATLFAETYSK